MSTTHKWLCAIAVVAIAAYFVWKNSSDSAPATTGTGTPDTGGLSLADNPSGNPFTDLFAAIAPQAAGPGAQAPVQLASKPAPRKDGAPRPAPARPNTFRPPSQIERPLAPLR